MPQKGRRLSGTETAQVDLRDGPARRGHRIEIVNLWEGLMPDTAAPAADQLSIIAGKTFNSRLIVGIGKYATYAQNAEAAGGCGAEIAPSFASCERDDAGSDRLIDHLDLKRFTYLPNTAGYCFTGEDAVRTLRGSRASGGWSL
jgi:thiazole synthase